MEFYLHYKFILLLGLFLISIVLCNEEVCNRKPLGSKTAALPPDDRFILEIEGVKNFYIPLWNYNVTLKSKDEKATFIAFTILVKGDEKPNEKNIRKPILLEAGTLSVFKNDDKVMQNCKNDLIQSNLTPKTSIKVQWTAPPKGNKCVTISAVVAIKEDVWFSSDGPLSKLVCEDLRKKEDMQPTENDDCLACGDARYLLTFEGTWSSNTHPTMYPETTVRFSDVVGAAHSNNFNLYNVHSEASRGLQMLAEQGNTTVLEREILDKLGTDVRTVIKATGSPTTNMSTVAMFRVSPQHHLVSLVSAVLPSPDWFLGVAKFELCDYLTNKWVNFSLLNLYLMDAGTDSGKTFTSANEVTLPQQPISSAAMLLTLPKEQVKPFAKLKFNLTRTYEKNAIECENQRRAANQQIKDENTESTVEIGGTTESPLPPTTMQPSDPSNPCPLTEWQTWECDGECGQKGRQMKQREHIINNIPLSQYAENTAPEIPAECLDISTTEFQECDPNCDENTETAVKRR